MFRYFVIYTWMQEEVKVQSRSDFHWFVWTRDGISAHLQRTLNKYWKFAISFVGNDVYFAGMAVSAKYIRFINFAQNRKSDLFARRRIRFCRFIPKGPGALL